MRERASETSTFQEISSLSLATVQGGVRLPIGRASEWIAMKFAQLFGKNVDAITPRPRNKDFLDNAIRRPAEPPSTRRGPRADNDN